MLCCLGWLFLYDRELLVLLFHGWGGRRGVRVARR
uniref:Uncharacterized protein n=1 Tax=Arundo donax TaxID=35708 RepID=A0A0A9FCA1_ARUDO